MHESNAMVIAFLAYLFDEVILCRAIAESVVFYSMLSKSSERSIDAITAK